MSRFVVAWLVVSVASLNVAHAEGRGHGNAKRKATAKAAPQAPRSTAISKSMGNLSWGMTKKAVLDTFVAQIREQYQPRLSKAPGAIEEDRIRREMDEEIKRVRQSKVDFNGQTSGWDVSFLKGEFAHNNGESMVIRQDENSENYYFFVQDRLWKWYKAFHAKAFSGGTFKDFSEAIQGRYGRAQDRQGKPGPRGEPAAHWLEWQDTTTRLRAIDKTRFYGFYCLVFEDKAVLKTLPKERGDAALSVGQERKHGLVEAVTAEDSTDPDANPDIVDRLTGKVRKRRDAAETPNAGATGPDKGQKPKAPKPEAKSREDDPFKGLDL